MGRYMFDSKRKKPLILVSLYTLQSRGYSWFWTPKGVYIVKGEETSLYMKINIVSHFRHEMWQGTLLRSKLTTIEYAACLITSTASSSAQMVPNENCFGPKSFILIFGHKLLNGVRFLEANLIPVKIENGIRGNFRKGILGFICFYL